MLAPLRRCDRRAGCHQRLCAPEPSHANGCGLFAEFRTRYSPASNKSSQHRTLADGAPCSTALPWTVDWHLEGIAVLLAILSRARGRGRKVMSSEECRH